VSSIPQSGIWQLKGDHKTLPDEVQSSPIQHPVPINCCISPASLQQLMRNHKKQQHAELFDQVRRTHVQNYDIVTEIAWLAKMKPL